MPASTAVGDHDGSFWVKRIGGRGRVHHSSHVPVGSRNQALARHRNARKPMPAGRQYAWTDWSDGLKTSHEIFAPVEATTYTANFTMSLRAHHWPFRPPTPATSLPWETAFSPGASQGLYPPGSAVKLSVIPVSGYTFSGWTGPVAEYGQRGDLGGNERAADRNREFYGECRGARRSSPACRHVHYSTPGHDHDPDSWRINPLHHGWQHAWLRLPGHFTAVLIPSERTTTTIKAIAYASGMAEAKSHRLTIAIEPLAAYTALQPARREIPSGANRDPALPDPGRVHQLHR